MKRQANRLFVLSIILPTILLSSCLSQPSKSDGTPSGPSAGVTTAASPSAVTASPSPTDWHSGVKTDYTGLTPYKPLAENYTRLKDGAMPNLEPSNHYGKLLPYLGEMMYGNGGYQSIRKYGLMTASGKLVTDPVYYGVYQGNYYNNATYSGVTMPAYTLMKLTDKIDKENPWNSERYAACATDGSWITKFDYSQIFFTDKVIILVRDNEKNDIDIMDYNGKLLYNTKSLGCYSSLLASSAYAFQSGYGEGLFAVAIRGGRSVFIDALTGDETYTDYGDCGAFSNGIAVVQQNGLYGYIDRSFSLIITPQFQWAEFFNNGRSVVHYPDNSSAIIDVSGTVLLKNQYYISRWDSNTFGLSDANNNYTYYDSELQPIMPEVKGLTPLYNGWFYYIEGDGVTVFKGGEKHTLHGVSGVNSISGDIAVVYKNDGQKWQEGLMTLSGKFVIPLTDYQSIFMVNDEDSGKSFALASTYDSSQSYKVYDTTGKLLFSGNGYAMYDASYGLFEVNDDLSFAYVDTSGNEVFRISLMKYLPD